MRLIPTTTLLLLAASIVPASAQFPGPYGPPMFAPPPGAFGPAANAINIDSSEDANGYFLTIHSGDAAASTIKIDINARGITVRTEQNDSREAQQNSPPGQGYSSYSYSYSSSHSGFSRFFSLPPDADSSNATREDGDHKVTVFIPRKK